MVKRSFLLALIFFILSQSFSFSQGIHNNGASVVVESGAYINIVNGSYVNSTQSSNDGSIDLDGIITLDGNFLNNAASGNVFINTDTDGEVIFAGAGTQTIGGTGDYIDFEKVTVNSGSQTQIPADKAATVNGALTVNGTFELLSPTDAGPSGSLITNATIGGTGNIIVHRAFNTAERWQYISIPMSGIGSDQLTETPNPGYLNPNFYTINEASGGVDPTTSNYSEWNNIEDAWVRIQPDIGVPQTLSSGTGYIFYHTQNVTTSFQTSTGPDNLSTGDKTFTVSYTDNDNDNGYGNYFDGWNIVGNPYPSAIDFSALTLTGNMNAALYLWDGTNENYVYYSPTNNIVEGGSQTLNSNGDSPIIPAMQSFIVHITNTNANDAQPILEEDFTIANSARTHNTQDLWKNKEKETPDFSYIKLKASSAQNTFTDETIVRFFPDASANFEGSSDILKMYSIGSETAQIYSLSGAPEFPLAIGTYPESNLEETSIPLGFKSTAYGNYTISAEELNFPFTKYVYLIDIQEDVQVNLKEYNSYSFTSEEGDDRDRFYLFAGKNAPSDTETDNYFDINIWSQRQNVFIRINKHNFSGAVITIYDLSGKAITEQNIKSNFQKIRVPAAEGLYIVKLQCNDGRSEIQKVHISK